MTRLKIEIIQPLCFRQVSKKKRKLQIQSLLKRLFQKFVLLPFFIPVHKRLFDLTLILRHGHLYRKTALACIPSVHCLHPLAIIKCVLSTSSQPYRIISYVLKTRETRSVDANVGTKKKFSKRKIRDFLYYSVHNLEIVGKLKNYFYSHNEVKIF